VDDALFQEIERTTERAGTLALRATLKEVVSIRDPAIAGGRPKRRPPAVLHSERT
jgi:hypothetical protein